MQPSSDHALCDLAGLRALVVEDQYLIARHVCRMLRLLGCEPIGPVPNLVTAFATQERETPDCALLDVSLGDELVYPFAEELRRRSVPFLFVTGYDQPVIAKAFRGEPHLGKPFNLPELHKALSRTVPSRASARGVIGSLKGMPGAPTRAGRPGDRSSSSALGRYSWTS